MPDTLTRSDLRLAKQRVPFHARQIARILALALSRAGFLDPAVTPDTILAPDHAPALVITAPDGRIFTVVVTEVKE